MAGGWEGSGYTRPKEMLDWARILVFFSILIGIIVGVFVPVIGRFYTYYHFIGLMICTGIYMISMEFYVWKRWHPYTNSHFWVIMFAIAFITGMFYGFAHL